MDAMVFSLALVLNVLFVMPGNWDWHHPMVSELLANWIIFAKKVTFSFYSLYLWMCAELVTPVLIIAINCPLRFLPRVNNLAQFKGFLSGFPLGFILLIRPQFGYKSRHKCQSICLFFTIIITCYRITTLVLLIIG
ncbi:rhomboid-like protein 5 [Quercus suber]|uniref:Rhomboid-like protein 5 n=1 Tax=Quercus suber TaxID=58331 RepID=A0AAW0IUG5_QUESU